MILQIFVYLIIAIFIGISQSAGIGGGPILNISLMLGLGFDVKDSMSITYIFLMGGSFASIWKNKNKKNSKTGNTLMDYNLILLTLPGTISGSIFGTILNHFISDLVITLLFVILLGYLILNSYQKLQQQNQNSKKQQKKPLILIDMKKSQYLSSMHQDCQRLKQILEYQKQMYPLDKLKIIVHIFVYTIMILLLKGGHNYRSLIGLTSCGLASWFLIVLHLTLSYLYSKSIAIKQYQLQIQKSNLGHDPQSNQDRISQTKMNMCMFYGFLAGLVGGMLGLGGAIVLVPAWINSSVDKNVAVASSGPLILFSAAVSFTLGLLSGSYNSLLQVSFYFVLAFIGSYFVKDVVTYISEKYNLKTMIYILLIIVMSTSLLTLLPYEFNRYLNDPQDFFQFGQLC